MSNNCTDHDRLDCPQPLCIERMERVMEARQQKAGNCIDHGHPDCYEPACVITSNVRKMQAELKLLRVVADTAKVIAKDVEKERDSLWHLVAALKEVMKQVEWRINGLDMCCVLCLGKQTDGHNKDCDLDHAIKGTLPIESAVEVCPVCHEAGHKGTDCI